MTLKRAVDLPPRAGVLPQEVFTRFADTGGREADIELPLPATPGLSGVKEVWLSIGRGSRPRPLDLTITQVQFRPAAK